MATFIILCVELWPCVKMLHIIVIRIFPTTTKSSPQYLHGLVYVSALHGSAELWTPIMSVSTLPALVPVRIIQTSSEQHQPKESYIAIMGCPKKFV